MRGTSVVVAGAVMGWLALGLAGGEAGEARPPGAEVLLAQAGSAPGPPSQGAPPGSPGAGGPGSSAGHGGGMMGQGMMGAGAHRGLGGPMGALDPMRGMPHLEHLMVHHPKEAARVMRFRADLYRALADVLARHAAELEK